MERILNKAIKVMVIIGIALLIISIFIFLIGYGLNSENIFYTGFVVAFMAAPACFLLAFFILIISAIIEEINKKR